MAKIGGTVANVTVPLVGQVDVLSTVEFSFRYDNSQWRSTCVFGAYIHVRLTKFFEGSILFKARNLSNIL